MKSTKLILLGLFLATCITSYGQVGVNNTDPDPSSLLDLNATDKGLLIPRMTSAERLAISSPANSLLVFDTSLNLYFYFFSGVWHPLNPWIPSVSTSDIYYSSGNVGIGTNSPLSKLHISHDSHINFLIDRTDTEDFMTLVNGSGGSGLKFSDSNFLFVSTDTYANRNSGDIGTELFRVTNNGNIGIGSVNPIDKLQVGSQGLVNIKVGVWATLGETGSALATILGSNVRASPTTNSRMEHITTTIDGARAIKMQFNEGISFHTFQGSVTEGQEFTGYERMRITNSGNVGIGTSSPAYKLDVNGTVNASALYVNGSPVSTGATIPAGGIIMWSGSIASIPSGWALCNGNNGTPNLTDRFIVGAGSSYSVGGTGGANAVTLTSSNIPQHTHTGSTTSGQGAHSHIINGETMQKEGTNTKQVKVLDTGTDPNHGNYTESTAFDGAHVHSFSTTTTNGSSNPSVQPISTTPPYYALAFIMKL